MNHITKNVVGIYRYCWLSVDDFCIHISRGSDDTSSTMLINHTPTRLYLTLNKSFVCWNASFYDIWIDYAQVVTPLCIDTKCYILLMQFAFLFLCITSINYLDAGCSYSDGLSHIEIDLQCSAWVNINLHTGNRSFERSMFIGNMQVIMHSSHIIICTMCKYHIV